MSPRDFEGPGASEVPRVDPSTDSHWLARPSTVRLLWRALAGLLLLTVLAQFFIPVDGKFPLESTFAFGAWYGFGCCVAMVLVARALGWWLKKPEDYYVEVGEAGEAVRRAGDGRRGVEKGAATDEANAKEGGDA